MLAQVFEYNQPLTVYGLIVYNYSRNFILYDPEAACFFLQAEMFPRDVLIRMYQAGISHAPDRAVRFLHIDCKGWVEAEDAIRESLSDFCKREKEQPFPPPSVPWIAGYPETISSSEVLRRLMRGENVPASDAGIPLREVPSGDEWYELETQAEADLLTWILGFHDAHIDRVTYREQSFRPDEVSVIFDMHEWNGCRVEYGFSEPTVAHITNGRYANGRDILSACLYMDDSGVFWADEGLDKEEIGKPFDPEITYIRARSVKVRLVD